MYYVNHLDVDVDQLVDLLDVDHHVVAAHDVVQDGHLVDPPVVVAHVVAVLHVVKFIMRSSHYKLIHPIKNYDLYLKAGVGLTFDPSSLVDVQIRCCLPFRSFKPSLVLR